MKQTALRSREHTMKKQFDYLQALDSSKTCVQCLVLMEGEIKEMESKGTTVHTYVHTQFCTVIIPQNFITAF